MSVYDAALLLLTLLKNYDLKLRKSQQIVNTPTKYVNIKFLGKIPVYKCFKIRMFVSVYTSILDYCPCVFSSLKNYINTPDKYSMYIYLIQNMFTIKFQCIDNVKLSWRLYKISKIIKQ